MCVFLRAHNSTHYWYYCVAYFSFSFVLAARMHRLQPRANTFLHLLPPARVRAHAPPRAQRAYNIPTFAPPYFTVWLFPAACPLLPYHAHTAHIAFVPLPFPLTSRMPSAIARMLPIYICLSYYISHDLLCMVLWRMRFMSCCCFMKKLYRTPTLPSYD